MKKKMKVLLLCTVMAVAAVGCGKKEQAAEPAKETTDSAEPSKETPDSSEDKNTSSEDQKAETDDKDQVNDTEKPEEADKSENDKIQTAEEVAAEGQKNVVIYYSNENADGLDHTEITMAELTPDALLGELVNKGVVSGDIQVISLEEVLTDGQKNLNLDLSKSFETYLNAMGSAGERMVVQSICNTYLKAYGCEKVKITVEGNSLSTGHAEYPGYLGFFE